MNTATPRQAQVLALREQGLSAKQIALQLGISPGTVKIHTKHLLDMGLAVRKPKATGWDRRKLDALIKCLDANIDRFDASEILAELKDCKS